MGQLKGDGLQNGFKKSNEILFIRHTFKIKLQIKESTRPWHTINE